MDENTKLALRLTKIYAKLLGERDRIENPPKYITRLVPDRLAYEAATPERQERLRFIAESLPHLSYVIKMLDPDFDEASIDMIHPMRPNNLPLPNGISGTAMDIVREAGEPLAPADIVRIMGEHFDLDLSTVGERQRYYDAINHAFAGSFADDLIEHPGTLPDNPGYRRRWSWKHKS